jgi:hypothetical protein
MEGLIVALAVTLPLIGLFVMLVYLRRMENSEKLSMIEKGVDPSLFARKKRGSSGTLRISLLLIGVGIGFVTGHIWYQATYTGPGNHDTPVPYFSMIFIFGGLGLLAAYLIEEKKDKQAGN